MQVAVDTETTGSDFWHGCKPFLVTACDGPTNYYWEGRVNPFDRSEVIWEEGELEDLQDFVYEADEIIFHNAKFDIRALESIGIQCKYWNKIHDTIIASHCLCSGERHALKYLAFKYLDWYNDEERVLALEVRKKRELHPEWDLAKAGHKCFPGVKSAKWYKLDYWVCPEECLEYGFTDVEMTWHLHQLFQDQLEADNLVDQYNTRRRLLEITYEMERRGIHFYKEEMIERIQVLTAVQETLRQGIQQELKIPVHLDLTKKEHLKKVLFGVLGLKVQFFTEKTKEPKITQDTLESYIQQNPEITPLQHFKDWREIGSQISDLQSYLRWMKDDRIHTRYWITGTRETRFTSEDPNMQNVSKSLRKFQGPPRGYVWLDFDLVSIEPRLWAYLCGNETMIENLSKGISPHITVSQALHPEKMQEMAEKYGEEDAASAFKREFKATWYQWVKNGNMSIMYSASERKADLTYRVEGAYKKISRTMPEVTAFTTKTVQEAEYNLLKHNSPFVETMGGYRLEVNMDAPFKACNYKIQGSAGWIMIEALINVYEILPSWAYLISTTHDSLVIEAEEDRLTDSFIQQVKEAIEKAGLKYVPTCEAEYDIIENIEAPF